MRAQIIGASYPTFPPDSHYCQKQNRVPIRAQGLLAVVVRVNPKQNKDYNHTLSKDLPSHSALQWVFTESRRSKSPSSNVWPDALVVSPGCAMGA